MTATVRGAPCLCQKFVCMKEEFFNHMRPATLPLLVGNIVVTVLTFPTGKEREKICRPWEIITAAIRLDADCVPVRNPEFLFETLQFKESGALLWPDRERIAETKH